MATKKRSGLGRGLGALISTGDEPELVTEETTEAPKRPVQKSTAKASTKTKQTKQTGKKTASPVATEAVAVEKPTEEAVTSQIIVDNQPKLVDIYAVEPDRDQPRKEFNADNLEELAQSIRQYGILQPILVNHSDDYYKIIAGERRWRAAKLAGLTEVPVLVKELTDERAFEISLIENIQRQDLNPIEEALGYKRLMDEYHMIQETVASRVGKSRSAVANSLRLLNLDPEIQAMLQDGTLSSGHAKVLSGVAKENQLPLAKRAAEEGWSVRQLENAVKLLSRPKRADKIEEIPVYREVENKMRDILGTKVNIQYGKRKGKIEIEYYSEEDLERLMMLFGSIQKETRE